MEYTVRKGDYVVCCDGDIGKVISVQSKQFSIMWEDGHTTYADKDCTPEDFYSIGDTILGVSSDIDSISAEVDTEVEEAEKAYNIALSKQHNIVSMKNGEKIDCSDTYLL